MSASEIISGVGARYGVVLVLDENGLPFQETPSATPERGIEIEGIKTLTANDPEPQRFTHYGDDSPFAQDSLQPQTVETFAISTAKTNLVLDTYLEGAVVRQYGSAFRFRVANSDQRGNEPLVMGVFYRQALDTDKNSVTFGRKREWNVRIYPSTRIAPITHSFETGIVDNTYQATPTPTSYTPWGEDIDTSNWGASRGSHLEGVMDYQPRVNVYAGNGTLTSWTLSHTPADSNNLLVWVGGSLTVPGSITYGASPAFTVSPAVGVGTQVFALIGTNTPTQA